MKYTSKQYEVAKKFREFYYKESNRGNFLEEGWWERMNEDIWNMWVKCYLGAPTGSNKEKEAFRKTEEFFNQKETVVKPSSYTFVSTDKDVDLLRIIREAPAGSPFILIERKNRTSNKTGTFFLVHESVLNNPSTHKLLLYDIAVYEYWGVVTLGEFPGINLSGTGYRAHQICDYSTRKLRAEIEAVIKALNPKDTKTTVTLW